jgi:hypothetical protein
VVRRLFPVFVLAMFLYAVPTALGATSPTQTGSHQEGLNTVSGADGPNGREPAPGETPEESVRAQYPPNSVVVREGEENGSFAVTVGWPDPNIDLDIYVYRIRDMGTPDNPADDQLDPNVIASAASLDDPEIAEYTSSDPDQPFVRPDRYIVAVHNYCSAAGEAGCTTPPDKPGDEEDQWDAEVTFTGYDPANIRPTVSLSGPTTGTTGQTLTYTASASDADGQISNVAFDLDGDGRFETDNSGALSASTRFGSAGLYTVGVRVLDNDGSPAFASVDVRVTGPDASASSSKRRLISAFKLNRPVFGGRKRNKLVVRYRLREPGRAIVSLYRGKKRVKRLSAGNRRAARTYRINVSPRRLRKGATYKVQLFVRSADGQRTQRVRLSAKRL